MSAFLTFTPTDGAKLMLTFSSGGAGGAAAEGEGEAAHALLVAVPQKPVPAFKRNRPEEIMKGMQQDKTKYYSGIAQFVKALKIYNSTVRLGGGKAPLPFQLIFLNRKNEITKLVPGPTPLTITDYVAAACIPLDCQELETKIMEKTLFLTKARAVGGGSVEF